MILILSIQASISRILVLIRPCGGQGLRYTDVRLSVHYYQVVRTTQRHICASTWQSSLHMCWQTNPSDKVVHQVLLSSHHQSTHTFTSTLPAGKWDTWQDLQRLLLVKHYHRLPAFTKNYHRLPVYHRLPRATTNYYRLPYATGKSMATKYYVILQHMPQTTTYYHRLQLNTTDYHLVIQTLLFYHRLKHATADNHMITKTIYNRLPYSTTC